MPDPPPRIGAVIVSWNSRDLLATCLASLRAQTVPVAEIVVVDNASTDGSLEVLRADPGLLLVENAQNRGFAGANNQGLAAGRADTVLLVNADVQLSPDYLQHCLPHLDDPAVGSVTGKLLRPGGGAPLDSTGHNVYAVGWAENRGEEEPDVGYDRPGEVFGVCAAAAVYRRAALESVADGAEVLDEVYFAYIEDIDLDWRLRWMGWRAMYQPAAVAIHHRSATGARHSTPVMRHILKNRLLTVTKNYDARSLWRNLPGIVFFSAVKAADFAREDPRAALGLVDFAAQLPHALRRRRWIREHRRAAPRDVMAWLRPFPWRSRMARRGLLRRPSRRLPGP